jgi:hypothetical protein
MGVEAEADESTPIVMGREREVLLLLPEEGAVDGEFGARTGGEFIGQSEVTRFLQNHQSGTSGHEAVPVCSTS